MYYSNMWEYGAHDTTVGVTGFLSCIGVAFVTDQQLYAIHIPGRQDLYVAAQSQFAMFVARTETPQVRGDILVFSNGTERPDVVNELRPLIRALNVNTSTLYLLNGAPLGNNPRLAAAVKVERLVPGAGGYGVRVKYEVNGNIAWVPGGTAPSGKFRPGLLGGGVVPNGPVNWTNITALNSQISYPW